jgi:hypothetical protein
MKRTSILVAVCMLAGLVAFANLAWAECTPDTGKIVKASHGLTVT